MAQMEDYIYQEVSTITIDFLILILFIEQLISLLTSSGEAFSREELEEAMGNLVGKTDPA